MNRDRALDAVNVRGQVEDFHRRFKQVHRRFTQLTGAGKCQCRTARAQRNRRQRGYVAWVSLRPSARAIGQTIYRAHQSQWAPYRRQILQNPVVQTFV